MKRITLLPLFFLVGFLVLMTIFVTVGPVFSEMTLNDNVNIEGALFFEGESSGLNFADGRRQTTAASPPWYQMLPGEKRFVLVMDDQAVLDRETGLVWERNTIEGDTYTWYAALEHCYQAYIGGRGGWRLPTMAELTTLIDKTQIPVLGEPFTNVNLSLYWSSTTAADNANFAWCVRFYDGGVGVLSKSDNYYVRAVRSGRDSDW